MTAANTSLQSALDSLYREFSRLAPNEKVFHCGCVRETCTATPELARAINQDDIHMVTDQQILHFHDGFPHLIGSPYELKRLIPRTMEFLLFGKIMDRGEEKPAEYFCPNAEEIFSTLRKSGFDEWSDDERMALERFLESLWKHVLCNPQDWDDSCRSIRYPRVTFNCIAQVVGSIRPFLNLWGKLPDPSALEALIQYINGSPEIFEPDSGLGNYGVSPKEVPAIRERKRELNAWLIQNEREDTLIAYANQLEEGEKLTQCLECIDNLAILRESSKSLHKD